MIDSFLPMLYGPGLETEAKYATKLFRKWIIGTARRAMNPGELLDGCFLLQGPASSGKTSLFRNILPEPFSKRTGEIFCDVKNPQKFVESIVGKTVACFDELSVLDHDNSVETFKYLLSSQYIDVRMPWARNPRRYLLRQGFAATTNRNQFITDPFLSRRLWIIQLNGKQRIDHKLLSKHRRDLWNEAVYFAEQGESCMLSPDEQKEVEEYNKQFEVK
jgi:putative DNA primase/helicase